MYYAQQFQINIFSIILLMVLAMYMRMSKIKTFSKMLIRWSILATLIGIIMEPLTWIFDGWESFGGYLLEYISNYFLYLIGPVVAGLLLSYMDYKVFQDPDRIRKRYFYQYISVLTLIILTINIFYPVYFSVEPLGNNYIEEKYNIGHSILFFGMYLYMLFFVMKNLKKVSRVNAVALILSYTLPIFGIVMNLVNVRLHFVWTSLSIVLVVFYIFLETIPVEEDHLTKLYNRRSYDLKLEELIGRGLPFGIMIVDLNYLKSINDNYGHSKGDRALIAFSKALKHGFNQDGFIARLGGDEFVVVITEKLDKTDKMIEAVTDYLSKQSDPVINGLTFSYGYQKYLDAMSADDLYIQADKKMYQHKRSTRT